MNKIYLRLVMPVVCVIALLLCPTNTDAQINDYTLSTSGAPPLDDMSSGTSLLIFSANDDVASSVQNIGFPFYFGGVTYTQFSVNSNGLMRLGSVVVSNSASNLLTGASDFPKICPYWDDLSTGTNGIVHFKSTGTSPNRKLTVEWNLTVPKNISGSANVKFQVWLFENTKMVQFVYGSGFVANSLNGGYTIGMATSASDFFCINAASSTKSLTEINNNTVTVAAGRNYRFTPPVPTTVPNCAINMYPAAGATGIAPNFNAISWSNGGGSPSGYDVYFGTNAASLPLVSSNQGGTTYAPGLLSWNTSYYYRIEPRNVVGPATGCSVVQFQTGTLLSYNTSWMNAISYSSINASGTSVTSWKNGTNTDDNLSDAVPIGFSFGYQGATFTNFLVSTNGFITLNTSTSATGGGSGTPYNYINANLSATGATSSPAIIAPFYEDLVCQGNPNTALGLSTAIRYQTTGVSGSRILTVEWIGMESYQNAGPNLNFQVKLYEGTNQIEFVYGVMEGFNGTSGYLYSYSCGINAMYLSPVLQQGELFCLQSPNSASFDYTASDNHNLIPECNSKIVLSPGVYNPTGINIFIPPNDEPQTAIAIPSNASPCIDLCGTYFSTLNATPSGQTVCSGAAADDDVWFIFNATNANTTIKVAGSGGFDPVIQLYNASINLLSCTDATGTGAFESLTTNSLIPGQDYFVRIYHKGIGSGSSSGQFSICVSATPLPPVNDNCSGAISLLVKENCNSVIGTQTVGATASSGIPTCFATGTFPDDDVWYKFVATNRNLDIKVQSGPGFNAVLQLFSGTCGNLNPISCLNNTSTGQLETISVSNLSIGQTYFIRVYHAAAGGGSGNFTICITSPKPVCPTGMIPANATSNIPSSGIQLRWNPSPNANGYIVYLDTLNPAVHVLANVTDTSVFSGTLNLGYTYYWRIEPYNGSGNTQSCSQFVFATDPFVYALNIKAFLEGFYVSNRTMVASINPTDTISDTLTVCLASSVPPYPILYTSKALLSVHGNAPAYFPQPALLQAYYIVLRHRNSLETWSSSLFAFNTPDTLYDFTNANSKSFGSNMIQMEPGVFALKSGDVNQDKFINFADDTKMNADLGLMQFGYFACDLNGDRIVESTDYSFLENRSSLFIFTISP